MSARFLTGCACGKAKPGQAPRLELDMRRLEARVDGRSVPLAPKELKILGALMRARGRVLGQDELLSIAWGVPRDTVDQLRTRTIRQHILLIRTKLGAAGRLIETRCGAGYAYRGPR